MNRETLFGTDRKIPTGDPLACAEPPTESPRFDGVTYRKQRDQVRLGTQLSIVLSCLIDGDPWAISDIRDVIENKTGKPASESGITARIRDLRKERFGGYRIDRIAPEHGGTWHYQMIGTK